jgi:hypothetical protein
MGPSSAVAAWAGCGEMTDIEQGWFWENLLLIFSSLSSFLFSLPLSFSLLFPLEDSIKEYYHHTEEESEDVEPCTTVFNPRIAKHCDLRGEGVEKWSCLLFGRGDLSGVCFCFERDDEREMCPWAISKYFGDWVSTQVFKWESTSMDEQSANLEKRYVSKS